MALAEIVAHRTGTPTTPRSRMSGFVGALLGRRHRVAPPAPRPAHEIRYLADIGMAIEL